MWYRMYACMHSIWLIATTSPIHRLDNMPRYELSKSCSWSSLMAV